MEQQAKRLVNYLHSHDLIQLPYTLDVDWMAFKQMYTQNATNRRIANPKLVEQAADKLSSALGDAGGEVVIDPIIVQKGSLLLLDHDSRILQQVKDHELLQAAPDSIVATRAMARVRIEGRHDAYSPMLVINMTDRGEEIAFGHNVSICSNMSILSAERRFSTFGQNKLKLADVIKQMDDLLVHNEEIFAEDLDLIEQLKEQYVHRTEWYAFLGELFSRINYVNHMRLKKRIKEVPPELKALPVTRNALNRIALESLNPSYEEYEWDGDVTDKWKLINHGTDQLKIHHGSSPTSVLQTNANWAQLIHQTNFSLN